MAALLQTSVSPFVKRRISYLPYTVGGYDEVTWGKGLAHITALRQICSLSLNQEITEVGEEPRLRQGLFPEEVIMSQDPEGEHDTRGT